MADFLSTLQSFESGDWRHPDRGGSNIANTHQGTSSGQAQGFNQITTGTWKEFGGLAYAPTPLQATQEQQNAIAAKIPLKRWAPETLAYLKNNGFTLNPNATLADNIALNHGALGTAPPPHTPTPGMTLNSAPGASTPPAGGPAASAAPGQPSQPAGGMAASLPGYQPNSPGAKMTAAGLQQLAGGGGGDEQMPPMPPMQLAPAMASGGRMMMGAGGQNNFGRGAAENFLAQQGFQTQPSLQYGGANAVRPPVPAMPAAQATGIPGLPGTTLNSPSQLQMALMTGQLSPYDMYAQQQGSYGGMNYG